VVKKLRNWIASLGGRVTGISTPIGGISWRPTEPEVQRAQRAADVRVKLVGSARNAHFVIVNVGDGTAHGVHFGLDLEDGQEDPLVKGDYDRKLPVEVLRSGDRVELLAALTFGSGVVFKARWRWREENGEQRERAEKLSLQSS
jgi:hypothetical protein